MTLRGFQQVTDTWQMCDNILTVFDFDSDLMDWGGATGISGVEVRDATPHPMAGTKDSVQRTEGPRPKTQQRPVQTREVLGTSVRLSEWWAQHVPHGPRGR